MNRRWSSPATTPSRLAVSTDHKTPTKAVRFLPAPVQEDLKDNQRNLTLAGLAFAAASGTLSGMSLVLAKAAVELLVITIQFYHTGHGENQFKRVQSWLLVLGLGIGAIAQLVYLNYSLTFASPALICPLAFCFFNLSSIFGESHTMQWRIAPDSCRRSGLLRPIRPTETLPDRVGFDRRGNPASRRMGRISHPARGSWSRRWNMGRRRGE